MNSAEAPVEEEQVSSWKFYSIVTIRLLHFSEKHWNITNIPLILFRHAWFGCVLFMVLWMENADIIDTASSFMTISNYSSLFNFWALSCCYPHSLHSCTGFWWILQEQVLSFLKLDVLRCHKDWVPNLLFLLPNAKLHAFHQASISIKKFWMNVHWIVVSCYISKITLSNCTVKDGDFHTVGENWRRLKMWQWTIVHHFQFIRATIFDQKLLSKTIKAENYE